MSVWVLMVLAAFAVYRGARMVATEEGPAEMFVRLREWAGAYDLGENGLAESSLGRGIACPYCVGVWLAFPAAAAVLWPTQWTTFGLVWLGLAGAQALITGWEDSRHGSE